VARNSSYYGPWGGAVRTADGTVVSLSRVQYTLSAQASTARDQGWEAIILRAAETGRIAT
jgi:hypothetical protein